MGRLGWWPVAAAVLGAAILQATPAAAAPAALAGKVTSAAEGPMEGVLVSAKREGSTITVTVVSDARGIYRFPAARLVPGHYALTIRAAGYQLATPETAVVSAGKPATVDLALEKAKDLAAQLTNAEWLTSMPATDKERTFLGNCVACHTLQRVMESNYSAEDFLQIFKQMAGYVPNSTPEHPQMVVGKAPPQRGFGPPAVQDAMAKFLASVNLSGGRKTWPFALKTFPRPKGAATKVIITEYALPRPDANPHDVILDHDGNVWYSDFTRQYYGEMNPRTGKVTDYKIPIQKKDSPMGSLDLETDRAGNIWIGQMFQTGVGEINPHTGAYKNYPLPAAWQAGSTQETMVSPNYSYVDGKVFTENVGNGDIYRLDPKTGHYDNLGAQKDAAGHVIHAYGIPTDHENDVYLLNFGGAYVGKIDEKTGKFSYWTTPTPYSRPRRGRVDEHDRLWFAEYNANAIGMFDPRTKKITEYPLPVPWSDPYDASPAADGDAWTGSMLTDDVYRLDPKTGKVIAYLLPRETNIRRVFVDNRTHPETLWVGSNHGAEIVKVEPLQ